MCILTEGEDLCVSKLTLCLEWDGDSNRYVSVRPGFSSHAFILMPPSDHTTHLCCLLQEFTSVGHNWLAMGVGGSVSLSFMPTYCIQQSFNTRLGSRRRPQAVPKYLNV